MSTTKTCAPDYAPSNPIWLNVVREISVPMPTVRQSNSSTWRSTRRSSAETTPMRSLSANLVSIVHMRIVSTRYVLSWWSITCMTVTTTCSTTRLAAAHGYSPKGMFRMSAPTPTTSMSGGVRLWSVSMRSSSVSSGQLIVEHAHTARNVIRDLPASTPTVEM